MSFSYLDVLTHVDKLTAEAKLGHAQQPRLKSCNTQMKVKHLITGFKVIRCFKKRFKQFLLIL